MSKNNAKVCWVSAMPLLKCILCTNIFLTLVEKFMESWHRQVKNYKVSQLACKMLGNVLLALNTSFLN